MTIRQILMAACLATSPAAALAETAPPPVAAVDPARLVAAKALMDQIMPPATRNQMIASIIGSVNQSVVRAIRQNPQMTAAIEKKPGGRAVFEHFMERQMTLQTQVITANLPGMLEAMAHAYARRFTLSQLHDIAAFFSTPTGQVYLAQSPTIMSDPDVATWLGDLMRNSMQQMPQRLDELSTDLKTLDGQKDTTHGG